MKNLTFIFIAFLSLSCCPEEKEELIIKPCNPDCGYIYDTRHFREDQKIRVGYITECKDTITEIIKLTPEQLGNDNGISFYENTFHVRDVHCDLNKIK